MEKKRCIICGKEIPPKKYKNRKTKEIEFRVYQTTTYCSDECCAKANYENNPKTKKQRDKTVIEVSYENRNKINSLKDEMNRSLGTYNKLKSMNDVISYLFVVLNDYSKLRKKLLKKEVVN